MDQRITKLANSLVNYSCELKKGEKVLIEAKGERAFPLVTALIKEAYKVGAFPYYRLDTDDTARALMMGLTEEQVSFEEERQLQTMRGMDAFIGVRASENVLELSDVPAERMKLYSSHIVQNVHLKERVANTRWVVLRYPSPTFAQSAKMSTEAFEDFYFKTCLLDYSKFSVAMDPLVELMEKTDKVHILSPGTDLKFSIKDIPVIKCDGKLNIPDGEVFTAPVKDSINGVLKYNTPTLYEGNYFDGVELSFENGKIIKAVCDTGDEKKLNDILNRDEGARYIGEFAIGLNPMINRGMLDILFDEKIAGSFHFTPGDSYDDAPNGNSSQIHWDMVCNQVGGGEIWFDDVLIRKDGKFTLEQLKPLDVDEF